MALAQMVMGASTLRIGMNAGADGHRRGLKMGHRRQPRNLAENGFGISAEKLGDRGLYRLMAGHTDSTTEATHAHHRNLRSKGA